MQVKTTQVVTYIAADQKAFHTKEACEQHEAELGPAEVFRLENNLSEADLATAGVWEYGILLKHLQEVDTAIIVQGVVVGTRGYALQRAAAHPRWPKVSTHFLREVQVDYEPRFSIFSQGSPK